MKRIGFILPDAPADIEAGYERKIFRDPGRHEMLPVYTRPALTIEQIRVAKAQAMAANFQPRVILLGEDVAVDLGIDVEAGLADGSIVYVDLDL